MIGWDPWDAELRRDPYPGYAALRREDPVHWSAGPEVWVVSRHAECDAVLHDRRFSSQLTLWEGLDLPEGFRPHPDLQLMDPPEHTRLRSVVAPAFTAGAVARLRARAQAAVDELLADAIAGGEVDFMKALAAPLPLRMATQLLGLPAADAPVIEGWADRIGAAIEQWEPDQQERWRAAQALFEYVTEAVEDRRRRRGEDLVSLVLAAEDAGRVGEVEAIILCVTLLVTSTQTPRDLLGNGALALLETGQLARLGAEPTLAAAAVEELLRWDSPMQGVDRVTLEQVELGGRRLRPRQLVRLLLGSANRDPERFHDPDRLDLERRPNPHLALAGGPHHCLGAPLGRLLAQVLFTTLAARCPGMRLAGPPVQRPWLTFRGLASLPVAFS